jgi:D-aminoacyl-tRNA deacylase
MNIANQLITNYSLEKQTETFQQNPTYTKKFHKKQTKLVFVTTEIVNTQFLSDQLNPEMFIFLSRHSSAKAIPTLSVHTPGNLSEAKFGGKPNKVSVSPAVAMKSALAEMAKQVNEKQLSYDVSYECTHHGPSLDVPSMFVELGSSPEQWKDVKAAEVVADAAVAAVSENSSCSAVVGIGGPHYNRKFTKLALADKKAFGHMIPKYALADIDAKTIQQCIQKTLEPVETVVLDWKGITGAHKPKIVDALDVLGVTLEKI